MTTLKVNENRVRRKAARKGLAVQKSASHGGFMDGGGYRLIDPRYNLPLLGKRYEASLSQIERNLDRL
jgi:hypothetical protein